MRENERKNTTSNRDKAIRALLTSRTNGEAAKRAGISESTLYRYMSDPDFMAAYKAAAAEMLESATRSLQRGMSDAAERLNRIVLDDEASANAQIAASRAILEYGLRFTEFNDILKELEGETDVL